MKVSNSKYCIYVILFTQATVFLPMGIYITALNPSTPAIEAFVNDTYMLRYDIPAPSDQIELIIVLAQTMLSVGALVSSTIVHLFVPRFSRKTNLALSHIIAIVSALLMSPVAYLANSYEALIIGRFLNGFARGLAFTITPLIVAETTTRRQVALFQSPTGWLIQLGSAMGNALAHPDVLGGVTTWPYLLALPGLFSLAYVLLVPWLPQTPAYLFLQEEKSNDLNSKSNFGQLCLKLLKKLRSGNEEDIQKEYDGIKEEISAASNVAKASLRDILETRQYRRQLFAAVVVTLATQGTGAQAVLQYSNTMFAAAGIGPEQSTFYAIGICVLMTIAAVACTPLLQKFGSRRILLGGLCVVSVSLVILTVSTVTSSTIPGMSYVSIVGLGLCVIGSAGGPMFVMIPLMSEITTQVTRPTVFWIAGMSFWLSATAIIFAIPYALNALGGYTYLFFLGCVLLSIIYVKMKIPDTHKRTVDEIQEMFQDKKTKKSSDANEPTFSTSLI